MESAGNEVGEQPSSDAPPGPRKRLMFALKILAAMLVIAAPALVASQFVSGVIGVAFHGVLAAAFGWISGGLRVGFAVVGSLAVLGVVVVLLSGHTVLLALILLALGVLYGYAAGRGIGSAVLQLPILTPYFMMSPPSLFTDPPVIGLDYFVGVVVVMLLSGGWTILLLHLVAGKRELKHVEVPDRRVPLLYGTILGVFSAVVMVIGTTVELGSHWVWVTLTLYVLADPTRLIAAKMTGRMLGTLAGFAVVTILALIGIPDSVLQILALPAVWLCLYFMIVKSPYWQYTLFLTIGVVLMNSFGVSTLLLDGERIAFTLLGAALSILAAFLVNLLYFHRRGITAPRS